MRNMSFSLTTEQIQQRTKTVTRRLGWRTLKAGDGVWAVKKCMGLKPGERVERLAALRVVRVRRERLDAITAADVAAEGFPHLSSAEFVAMFCAAMRVTPSAVVTRIEFAYVDDRPTRDA